MAIAKIQFHGCCCETTVINNHLIVVGHNKVTCIQCFKVYTNDHDDDLRLQIISKWTRDEFTIQYNHDVQLWRAGGDGVFVVILLWILLIKINIFYSGTHNRGEGASHVYYYL